MKKLLIACLLTGGMLNAPLFGAEARRSRQPIFEAINKGDLSQVKTELEKEGNLDLDTDVGATGKPLLRHAIHALSLCLERYRSIIKALVDAGATVGKTWRRAPEKGIYDIDLIEFLLTSPTAINTTANEVQLLKDVPQNVKDIIKKLVPKERERMSQEDWAELGIDIR